MKLLLTGATGFIGRHVLSQALAEGHDVRALCRRLPTDVAVHERLEWLVGDWESIKPMDLLGCDVLIHLAAHGVVSGSDDWEECFRINVQNSVALWQKAAEAGVRRFRVGGSCFEYGPSSARYDFIPVDAPLEPVGAYAASKAAASVAAIGFGLSHNVDMLVMRIFHVFGEGENPARLWPSLRRAALAGTDFPMTAGDQIRDFSPVEEVASKILRLSLVSSEAAQGSRLTNLGSGRQQSVREFAENWWRQWRAKGELMFGALPYRENEIMRCVPKI